MSGRTLDDADLTPLLAELRAAEPSARAFFIFGSFARGDAGPHSDLDLRVMTLAPPVERDRVRLLELRGRLLHASIGTRSLPELIGWAQDPARWPILAGFCAVARMLEDPQDLLGVLRHNVELLRPARLDSADGLHKSLEDLLEYLGKCRNAAHVGDSTLLLSASHHVSVSAVNSLLPLAEVGPIHTEQDLISRALAALDPGAATDHALCAGLTPVARDPSDVLAAAERLTRATVRALMAEGEALPLGGALRGYLLDGTVARYVEG